MGAFTERQWRGFTRAAEECNIRKEFLVSALIERGYIEVTPASDAAG